MINKAQPNRPPSSSLPDLSLVVPCYNEADVIYRTASRLIEEFEIRRINVDLILVDNGSTDDTRKIIDEMITEGMPIIKQVVPINQGYGNGILEGLKACQGKYVGFVCADGQVEARDVVRVYEIAANARTPMLVKVRRRFRMDGLVRKVVSIGYNFLTVAIFGGLGSIDVNGNPKIFPSDFLEQMNLESKDWFLDAEVLIKAKELKLEVYELNVIAQMREGGKSNVHSSTIWEFIINLWKYRFGSKRMRKGVISRTNEGATALHRGN